MKKTTLVLCFTLAVGIAGCSKARVQGRIAKDVHYYSEDYAATPNDVYYAVRWALQENGYAVASENLGEGIIQSTWAPTTSDSHYIELFDRRDYGATNSYYKLKVYVLSRGGRTLVRIGAPVMTLVANMKSSGIEEKKVLALIGDYLRKSDPDLTNIGVNE